MDAARDAAPDADAAMIDAPPPDGDGVDAPPPIDAPMVDGGPMDAEVPDAEPIDGGPLDTDIDAGPPGCDLGLLMCPTGCVRPQVDPANCGDCGVVCAAGEVCSDGTCAPICAAPLVFCDPLCVDTMTDPDHCGVCGTRCGSGICIDGECSSGLAGHVVLVGHDYRNSRSGMRRVAGNAVFLATGSPVRVLVYEGFAVGGAVAGTDRALDQTATALGRTWARTEATSVDEVPLLLADADVFVVYAQRDASDADLLAAGASWSTALSSFVRRGNVVVVFDGDTRNAGTWQVLAGAGLLSATAHTDVSGDAVRVSAASDAVALGVPLMYSGETTTVVFDSPDETMVVSHPSGPVVIHRTVSP
jgi:hypothetical protein